MINKIDWIKRDDGVIYFEPIGFDSAYFIYPKGYDDNTLQNELNIIDKNGTVLSVQEFNSIEDAKSGIISHLKKIIEPHLKLF